MSAVQYKLDEARAKAKLCEAAVKAETALAWFETYALAYEEKRELPSIEIALRFAKSTPGADVVMGLLEKSAYALFPEIMRLAKLDAEETIAKALE